VQRKSRNLAKVKASPTSARIADSLTQAASQYQAGHFVRARTLYDAILKSEPRNFDALFWLGVIAAQSKDLARAVEWLDKAIEIKPGNAAVHSNRGAVLAELRQWEAALASYDQAVALKPDYAVAYSNRGNVLLRLKRAAAALASFDRAIALKPDFAEAYCNRGNALKELNQYDAALASCDRAIAIRPDLAEAYCNRGIVQRELGQLDQALVSYNQAIAITAGYAEAYCNRGIVLQELRQLDAALNSYDQAISLRPDFAEAFYNRSVALLMRGDFERGWIDHEWRWKIEHGPSGMGIRAFAEPPWLGEESIAGKTLLLYCEQGLGDTLQFCRYAKFVADLGARVVLEVQKPLASLLAGLDGVAQSVVQGEALPAFDYRCPLMSLPLAFKTTLSTVPARVPYLKPDANKVAAWSDRLGEKRRPRVGLVWSGGFRPNQPELWSVNQRRNIPLSALAGLKNPDIEFYSLQIGQPAQSELAELISNDWDGPQLIDLTRLLNDFSDTAALIENLDLVISVDTSTAHLAGALGKPAWILNRFDTCWRWLLDRTDSPWYPTVRLYRQESPGDWDGVVRSVVRDLGVIKTATC
jgi:tetratricopeptide (TPR) repeat protein